MMKKLLNLLTMLLLLVVSQEMVGKTIYFYNNSKWATPYVYAWANSIGDASHNAAWPGVKLSDIVTTTHGVTVYKIELDDSSYDLDRVKFSNNGSGTQQTGDLVLTDGGYYNCAGSTSLEAIEKDAGMLNSYYLVGKNYASGSDAFENWDETDLSKNADYKFKKNKNVYSYTFVCTESSEMRFRLRQVTDGGTSFEINEWGPSGKDGVTLDAGVSKDLVYRSYSSSDGFLILNMLAGNTYTIYFNKTDNKIFYTEAPTDPASYKLVAKSQKNIFKMPMSETRKRDSNLYNYNYYTAGFKADLLPGDEGEEFEVYIEKTAKDGTVSYLYPSGNVSNNLVESLGLDYSNLKSVENVAYATSEGNTKLIVKKTKPSASASDRECSYTVALNLGGAITRGSDGTDGSCLSFNIAANSIVLYRNKSISDVYKNMYGSEYKGINEDYYLIGKLDGATYRPHRHEKLSGDYTYEYDDAYDQTHKMERKVFYNPIYENQVDSVVYSKVVKKTENGFNELFLSFAPDVLLRNAANVAVGSVAAKQWGYRYKNDGGNASKESGEAFNYLVRPEVFDNQDATATMGSVFFRGVETGTVKDRMQNGNQGLNPLVLNSADYDYYIVRLNVTTSTYRIEFVKKEKIKISVDGIRTYCGQTSLRIPTNDTKGLKGKVHFYAVQSYEAPEGEVSEYKDKQGTLRLRALNYIPANEPIVLVVDPTTVTTLENTTDENGKTTYWLDLEVMYDTDADYTAIKQKWWKNYNTADGYRETDPYFNYLKGNSMEDIVIPNGIYTIENGKYKYAARNFALNRFFNTYYFNHVLTAEERAKYREDEATNNYFSFFRAKGKVYKGYAYLQLPSSVMNFDGQLLDHAEDDNAHFAKMNLVFDDIEGDVTGIEEVKTGSNASVREDGAYYTLQGLKVEKPTKGLYIHNGKKVIVK